MHKIFESRNTTPVEGAPNLITLTSDLFSALPRRRAAPPVFKIPLSHSTPVPYNSALCLAPPAGLPCGSLKNSSKIKKINNNEPARARTRPRAHAHVVVDFLVLYIILSISVDNYITRGRARKTAEVQSVKIPNWSKIPQFAQNCDKFTNILSKNSTPLPKATFNTPKHFTLKLC